MEQTSRGNVPMGALRGTEPRWAAHGAYKQSTLLSKRKDIKGEPFSCPWFSSLWQPTTCQHHMTQRANFTPRLGHNPCCQCPPGSRPSKNHYLSAQGATYQQSNQSRTCAQPSSHAFLLVWILGGCTRTTPGPRSRLAGDTIGLSQKLPQRA